MSALDDCFLHDRDRLQHTEALALLRDGLVPTGRGTELVPAAEALGRVLAEDVSAPFDMPGHTNAAVDGYAFWAAEHGPRRIVGRITAGSDASPLGTGECARIFTGAPVPEGADTVAMQEDCHVSDGTVELPQLRAGANVRLRGEDVRKGEPVLRVGRRLRPADVATLAAFGMADVSVRAKLRVAILSSGDEVRQSGTLAPGQLFDANRPLLRSWMATLPVEVVDGGVLSDRRDAVETALRDAAGKADVILTTGGASRGDEDHMLAALDRIGRRHAWQIAVKPGRPLMFGTIGDAAYLGLPGNPVAACVCFLLYARPLLLALAGAGWHEPLRTTLPARFAIESKPDRREFLRGILAEGGVRKFDRDGSGLLSSLREADGLIEVPEGVTRIREGDPVAFLPWQSFL